MNSLYLILVVPVAKLIMNGAKYYQTRHYFNKYAHWVGGHNIPLKQMQYNIVKLFKAADIPDHHFSDVTPIGYGRVQTANNISLFENISSKREEHVNIMRDKFHQALGTYKSKALEVFNPIYWIESVLYLPRNILMYVGIPTENIIAKISQIIYWFIGSIFTLVYMAYSNEISDIIKTIIEGLIV